ncbi:hypothetical protein [Tichowtungia aerotolerans]|uniref:Uncharacterized protein n=1 Tax=Tichowtungia aerotolerans TaxID=2697043 RepID=A0A6P1M9Q2_9BACT|nr:hypothetical protein [Tichowtungia aerotolerans]QHI69284.1 hypothetical protein GT409_07415 [Tichowtungia aerotolerans]
MNYQREMLSEAQKAIAETPEQRSKITDLYQLAMDEIEDGGSESHEYELFMGEIETIKEGTPNE